MERSDCFSIVLQVDCFFWDIGIVDKEELRKPDISPEDTEGKNEFAQVMQMVRIHNA